TVNLSDRYTFWSGMIGGLFLMLGYFGCDQSQVQRYLTAKSVDGARQGLMVSAYVKIPLQLLILFTGVLVFVFYLFQPSPMVFNRVYDAQIAAVPDAADSAALPRPFDQDAVRSRRAGAPRGRGSRVTRCAHDAGAARGGGAGAGGAGKSGRRRRAQGRPELHLTALRRHSEAVRPGRPADPLHLRGGDVGGRRRADSVANRGDRRLLPPLHGQRRVG